MQMLLPERHPDELLAPLLKLLMWEFLAEDEYESEDCHKDNQDEVEVAYHSQERSVLHDRIDVVVDELWIEGRLAERSGEEVGEEVEGSCECAKDGLHHIGREVAVDEDEHHD